MHILGNFRQDNGFRRFVFLSIQSKPLGRHHHIYYPQAPLALLFTYYFHLSQFSFMCVWSHTGEGNEYLLCYLLHFATTCTYLKINIFTWNENYFTNIKGKIELLVLKQKVKNKNKYNGLPFLLRTDQFASDQPLCQEQLKNLGRIFKTLKIKTKNFCLKTLGRY